MAVSGPVLLCADGSLYCTSALARALDLIGRDHEFILVTVADGPDPTRFAATGLGGGVLSPQELAYLVEQAPDEGSALLDDVAARLGLEGAEKRVLVGLAGATICSLAEEIEAGAVVMGTRGHSGLLRAVLGSVSDHVVHHSSRPVLVVHGNPD